MPARGTAWRLPTCRPSRGASDDESPTTRMPHLRCRVHPHGRSVRSRGGGGISSGRHRGRGAGARLDHPADRAGRRGYLSTSAVGDCPEDCRTDSCRACAARCKGAGGAAAARTREPRPCRRGGREPRGSRAGGRHLRDGCTRHAAAGSAESGTGRAGRERRARRAAGDVRRPAGALQGRRDRPEGRQRCAVRAEPGALVVRDVAQAPRRPAGICERTGAQGSGGPARRRPGSRHHLAGTTRVRAHRQSDRRCGDRPAVLPGRVRAGRRAGRHCDGPLAGHRPSARVPGRRRAPRRWQRGQSDWSGRRADVR